MSGPTTHRAVEAVWRIESARLIAGLARAFGDVGTAEDLAQDALVAALEAWPADGVPRNPGAWLMSVARRRGIDALRRRVALERRHELIGHELRTLQELDVADAAAAAADDIDDDVLRLVFMTCHPVLTREARVALTLRLVGGLATPEIARAFLLPEATLAQRIVRAKKTLSASGAPFEMPGAGERAERLDAVLEVVYLVFNEGYAATAGDDWTRPALCREAMRLGRILAGLMPREPEVHGLAALMELQASRLRARVGPGGAPVPLADQDRARWDGVLVRRGLRSLARADELGSGLGPYGIQAAIAACHARARTVAATDWARIAALYGALVAITGSPVVELNRAVAMAMADGPAAGLAIVDAVAGEPVLAGYHLLPAVRGDLLDRLGRGEEARAAFARAAEMCANGPERAHLSARARAAAT